MKTFVFKSRWGNEYEIRFVRNRYVCGGSVSVEVENLEPDFGYWEPYGMLTVNLGHSYHEGTAHLDANNLPDLVEYVLEQGWAKQIGLDASGYCKYPLVAFTSEFLEEICE